MTEGVLGTWLLGCRACGTPASASIKMPMICSSLNRFFITVPLWSGLYTVHRTKRGEQIIAEHLQLTHRRIRPR